MKSLWYLFKVILTLALLTIACVFGFAFFKDPGPAPLLIGSIFILFSSMIWVDYINVSPKRVAFGVALFGLTLIYMAYEKFSGLIKFPRECDGRRRLVCQVENWLFEVGGSNLAAIPTFTP